MSTLVLSRKEQEIVVLFTGAGEQVNVTVESIKGGNVKLKFDAPKSVDIWRDELLEDEPL